MKCQSLFSEKNKKNVMSLSSAESAVPSDSESGDRIPRNRLRACACAGWPWVSLSDYSRKVPLRMAFFDCQ